MAGQPPSPTPSSSSPTDFPGPSTSITPTPSTSDTRTFTGSGIRLTVPEGYVIATTAAEAAERFPDVLGTDAEARSKISDAQTRLRKNTIMIAFHPPLGGLSDNIGLLKIDGAAPSDPGEIQSPSFQASARKSLTGAGAKNIEFTDTKIGGSPAEQVTYTITVGSSTPVNGEQFYVAGDTDVFILTVTAGTQTRTEAAASEIADSWEFQ